MLAILGLLVAVGSAFALASVRDVPPLPPGYQRPTQPEITAAPLWPHIAVIGDSYVAGSDVGGRESRNWSRLLMGRMKWVGIQIDGVGGSGYVEKGGRGTYAQRAENILPIVDLVIFCNGFNDLKQPLDRIEPAVRSAIAAARSNAPHAKIVVIGPSAPNGGAFIRGSAALQYRDHIRDATEAAGADFIDPMAEDWFGGKNRHWIGTDGIHPTNAGHVYYADRVQADINKLGLANIEHFGNRATGSRPIAVRSYTVASPREGRGPGSCDVDPHAVGVAAQPARHGELGKEPAVRPEATSDRPGSRAPTGTGCRRCSGTEVATGARRRPRR